jgi:hypothetical protein
MAADLDGIRADLAQHLEPDPSDVEGLIDEVEALRLEVADLRRRPTQTQWEQLWRDRQALQHRFDRVMGVVDAAHRIGHTERGGGHGG